MIKLFWKNSSYVNGLSVSVCIFGALWLRVLGWLCLLLGKIRLKVLWVDAYRNQWRRFWHLNMTLLKVKQRHFEIAVLILHNFLRLLLRLRVFWNISLKYLGDSNAEYSDAAVKGSYFSVGAGSRHFWPNSAIANGPPHVFHKLWVLFYLLQGRA